MATILTKNELKQYFENYTKLGRDVPVFTREEETRMGFKSVVVDERDQQLLKYSEKSDTFYYVR